VQSLDEKMLPVAQEERFGRQTGHRLSLLLSKVDTVQDI
jgi:hypothetical protein